MERVQSAVEAGERLLRDIRLARGARHRVVRRLEPECAQPRRGGKDRGKGRADALAKRETRHALHCEQLFREDKRAAGRLVEQCALGSADDAARARALLERIKARGHALSPHLLRSLRDLALPRLALAAEAAGVLAASEVGEADAPAEARALLVHVEAVGAHLPAHTEVALRRACIPAVEQAELLAAARELLAPRDPEGAAAPAGARAECDGAALGTRARELLTHLDEARLDVQPCIARQLRRLAAAEPDVNTSAAPAATPGAAGRTAAELRRA